MAPLVSVVIPTANRPQTLPRSIDSALAGMDLKNIEVIVVPNGPDESWRETLRPYENNHSVRVIPIEESNANIARNAGLAGARGDFVRFLDDDDYLVPEGAIIQYNLIRSSGVDVVSGSVLEIDEKGGKKLLLQPDKDDLCEAVLAPRRRCLNNAYLYRRSRLKNARWNPETRVRQDYEWLFELCTMNELSWAKIDDVVGVWQHHNDRRVSTSKSYNEIRKLTVPMFMKAYETLSANGRLNKPRRLAIAQGLWDCAHTAFFLAPLYWTKVARIARGIDPDAHLVYPVRSTSIAYTHPLLVQWLLFPKRWILFQIRQLKKYRSTANAKSLQHY
jgi:glycosyltransferase involved in cell wall biosynthesis